MWCICEKVSGASGGCDAGSEDKYIYLSLSILDILFFINIGYCADTFPSCIHISFINHTLCKSHESIIPLVILPRELHPRSSRTVSCAPESVQEI
jgi:hypothetical protein